MCIICKETLHVVLKTHCWKGKKGFILREGRERECREKKKKKKQRGN